MKSYIIFSQIDNKHSLLNLPFHIELWCNLDHVLNSFFLRFYLFIFRERGKEGERETSVCGCFSCAPYWGPGPQPRHVLWLGIQLVALWFPGRCSIHWATPARACTKFLYVLQSVEMYFLFVCFFDFSANSLISTKLL